MTVKNLLITVIGGMMLIVATPALAHPVTHDKALNVARQFMSSRGMTVPASATNRATFTPDPLPSRGGVGSPLTPPSPPYYVFNADRGYVVVSGDDRTAAVLGYADSGTFDEENMSDGLKWLLQTYSEQIEQLDELFALHEGKQLFSPQNQVALYNSQPRHSIDPLLSMTWNQGDPYNQLCPIYYNQDGTEGGRSATGCVATAMAQVIGYYRWPERTRRTIPGYIQKYSTDQGEKSVRLNSIPAGSVIDWDNILDNYNGSETEAQKKAIAELMLWVGMDCKMNYGAASSSGFSEGIDGLVNYFDYDDGTHVAKRELYTLQQWNDLIYNEIATGHPVPFGGQNSGGGHAFVLDGYDANGLFHVNWGWGGMSNSYFRIDVLDPGNNSGIGASLTPGGYNMGQDAIIGMRLPDGIKADEEDTPQYRYKLSANDWELRGTNRFFANYVNWSGVSATWNMGIGYVNEEGRLTVIGNYATAQISQNFFSAQEFTVSGLPEGTYHIVPISKRSTDTAWRTNMSPELRYVYTEVDADGHVVKMEIRPIVNIVMTSLNFPGNHKRGVSQTVSATFRNDGDDELFTEIHLFASLTDDKGEAICRTLLNLPVSEEGTIALNFKPEQTGTWNVWLATDNQGQNIVGQGTVEVTDEGVASGQQLRYMSHTISNRSNGIVYGNCFQGRVTIQNTNTTEPFDGIVHLWLFKQADNGLFYDAGSVYVPLQIEPRRTAQASYYFGNLELDENYAMSILYSEGGDIQDGGLRPMGRPNAGIVYWQQNQSLAGMAPQPTLNTPSGALAVDLTAAKDIVKTVRPNSNPNTLYILPNTGVGRDLQSLPEGLDGCNVIVGNHADNITLCDGYSFFTPLTFTATEATFTREISSQQWQTIVLPFKPQQLPEGLRLVTFTEMTPQGEPSLSEVAAMERYLPYLMYAADSEPQIFSATDARFSPTAEATMAISAGGYTFEGTTISGRQQQVYVLNDEGTAFEPASGQVAVKPFTAWFRAPEGAPAITLSEELTSPMKLKGTVIGTSECVDYANGQKTTTVNTCENAFDGNLDTFFASWERSYTWAGLDLGEPYVISRVGWSPRNDGLGEGRVVLGVFEGANSPDFMDALPLYVISEPGIIGTISHADVTCSKGFRYVRYVGPSDARCNIAELEFYGQKGEGDESQLYQVTNLPTVSIHTLNGEIPYDKEHQIVSQLTIVSAEGLLSEPGTTRERGNVSRSFPKKPYRIKFDKKKQVLNAPTKAKKWTLINNYGDKTLMRNLLAFELSHRMGMPYTPYGTAVDVLLNGEYKGCYQLCDQIEVKNGRVDIVEMTPQDNEGVALTGGYLVEVDAYANDENSWFMSNSQNPVTIKSPDEDSITNQQFEYIRSMFNTMEKNWRTYLDKNTFLRHFLVGELSGNTDTYWSVFMYKDRDDDLFYTGPVWDFDLAFENDQRTFPVNNKTDFIYRSGGSCTGNMKNFVDNIVVRDAASRAQLLEIWDEARQNGLNEENLVAFIDSLEAELDQSQQLNFKRWPIMNSIVHQNPYIWGSFKAEVENVRRFMKERIAWMDKRLNYVYVPSAIADSSFGQVGDYKSPPTAHIDFTLPYIVYSLQGKACGNDLRALPPGIYIVRQGEATRKCTVGDCKSPPTDCKSPPTDCKSPPTARIKH